MQDIMQLIHHLSNVATQRLGASRRDRGDWVAWSILVGFEKYCCIYGLLISATVRTTANQCT